MSLTFEEWYAENKEILTTRTFEYAMRTAFEDGQLSVMDKVMRAEEERMREALEYEYKLERDKRKYVRD